MTSRDSTLAILAGLLLLPAWASAGPGVCYQVEDLGPAYFDWAEGQRLGINPQGTVVGTTGASAEERRGFAVRDGQASPLGSLGGDLSDVRAVNPRLLAVGGSRNAEGRYRAASFHRGVVTDLGTLDGTNSWAMDVNGAGLAVGNAPLDGTYHAVAFDHGRVIDLGSLGGNTFANGVNDRGDVVGSGMTADGTWKGFLVPAHGELQLLGTIGGAGTYSAANQINNGGTVCGAADAPGGYHAFLYRDGEMTDLGPSAPGFSVSECWGVSDTGTAVGFWYDEDWAPHAFVWRDAQEGLVDLNFQIPGWSFEYWLYRASNVNSAGQITAYGWETTGWTTRGYLLSPVDCP